MRHIPSVDWMVWKLDADVRRRVDILYAPFAFLSSEDPHCAPLEAEFRSFCRALDRFIECARHTRAQQTPPDLASRLPWTLNQAVTAAESLDRNLFGRRYPFQTFERSRAESVYAALLLILNHLGHLVELVRAIDQRVDERLLEELVALEQPLREEPIA